MIAYLLHIANRNIKGYSEESIQAFYAIKDAILKKYAQEDGYDIQKIPGKRCNSCHGTGQHPKYGHNGKVYDWADCYHCMGGWYRFPKWICLQRYKLGSYHFHRPLKRHECVSNPFTKDELGWQVTDRQVIQGYIEHDKHKFGKVAVLLLFLRYNYPVFKSMLADEIRWKKSKFRWWLQEKKRWIGWLIVKPEIRIKDYYDENFAHEQDLPF
jgi:hypothetical protein